MNIKKIEALWRADAEVLAHIGAHFINQPTRINNHSRTVGSRSIRSKEQCPKARLSINIASNSLLTGMIYDGGGDRLSPIHSKKPNGRRYRYYISARLSKGEIDDGSALRLPAKQIEGHVLSRLTDLLRHTSQVMGIV